MARILIASNGIRIARAAALALLVGGTFASPAMADWQPRASIAFQAPLVDATSGDWQPRRSINGVVSVIPTRNTHSTWKARTSVGSVEPAEVVVERNPMGWRARSAVTSAVIAVKPASLDWKPRGSVVSGAVLTQEFSGKRRARQALTTSVVPVELATSSIAN